MTPFHRLSWILSAFLWAVLMFLLLSSQWSVVDGKTQIPFQINGNAEATTTGKVRHFYVGWPTLGGGHPKENPPVRLIITAPVDVPNAVARPAPVIVFLSGMFGLVPAFWYNPLWSQVAASGSVVLSLDLLTALPTNYETSARYLEEIFEWVQNGRLARWLQENVPKVIIDPKQLVLAGHSSGAQSVIWAYPTLRKSIRAILLLDPVDSYGEPRNRSTGSLSAFSASIDSASTTTRSTPFPFPPLNPAVLPRLKLTEDDSRGAVIDPKDPQQYQDYHAPMLFLSTGLCHLSTFQIPSPDIPQLPPFLKDSLWPACCPRGLGPRRFWNAFPQADRWNLNATEFGHCDLLATPWALFNRVTGLCKTNLDLSPRSSSAASIAHVSRFRAWMARRINAFFDLALYNDCEAKTRLENQETGDKSHVQLQLEKSYWSQSENPCLRNAE